jgi:membrane-bound serine protease (ClpP class)
MRRLPFGLLALALLGPVTAAAPPTVRWVEFDATVNGATAERITQAIDDAEQAGDTCVVIRLDTPGGLVDSMQAIVQRMLNAKVPVVAWVGPSGAHAASAGFFILLAADVAAMAPGTRTGAASSVTLGGENRNDDVLLKKVNEDLGALVRSMADKRGRSAQASERAVFEAKAYEETAALEQRLIDFVVPDRGALLARLDGREVQRFDGTRVTLHTAGATITETRLPWRQRFMEGLSHPVIAFLLFLGATAGIYAEFTHPGAVLPGVAGALCLLLFALAAQVLPISAAGVLLVVLGLALFLLEIKVTSFGLLALCGTACLILGSAMLVRGPIPEMRVPLRIVLPTSLMLALLCFVAVTLVVKAQRERVSTGSEALSGQVATVTRDLGPEGQVAVHGEIWSASCLRGPVARGTRVRILGVDGLRLTVEPIDGPGESRS